MIYDVIAYNGERELFDLRYHILKDYVDEFVVVEFDKTFSGRLKQGEFLKDYAGLNKVSYHWHTEEFYNKYMDLAAASSDTQGADHWKREFCQKESIKDALVAVGVKDEDIVFIGDCDEIWDSKILEGYTGTPCKLSLRVYTYYLNNRSSEEFYGTFLSPYGYIRDKCLNHLRTNAYRCASYFYDGWHFTSMHHQLEKKLKDSYTEESYATKEVMANLQDNIKNDRDFLGRNFTYTINESDWPPWLRAHREDYKHLLKPC